MTAVSTCQNNSIYRNISLWVSRSRRTRQCPEITLNIVLYKPPTSPRLIGRSCNGICSVFLRRLWIPRFPAIPCYSVQTWEGAASPLQALTCQGGGECHIQFSPRHSWRGESTINRHSHFSVQFYPYSTVFLRSRISSRPLRPSKVDKVQVPPKLSYCNVSRRLLGGEYMARRAYRLALGGPVKRNCAPSRLVPPWNA